MNLKWKAVSLPLSDAGLFPRWLTVCTAHRALRGGPFLRGWGGLPGPVSVGGWGRAVGISFSPRLTLSHHCLRSEGFDTGDLNESMNSQGPQCVLSPDVWNKPAATTIRLLASEPDPAPRPAGTGAC